jgi:predicted nucleic acid-binding Zn ribbon protein
MARYEYECVACSIRMEIERPITESGNPKCCGFDMRQVYYAPGIEFEGNGWGYQ